MSQTHIYASLSSVNSIRLLRLHSCSCDEPISCSLVVVDDYAVAPEYYALSYCWGDANDKAELILNGTSFSVTKSLYAALDRLLEITELPLVWADAICINQDNYLERNQQVSIMRQIYQRSSRVYIWAGHSNEYSSSALKLIQSIGYGCCMEAYGPVSSPASWLAKLRQEVDRKEVVMNAYPVKPEEIPRTNWEPFWQFYQAGWFFRVWVIQEVQSSPHVWLIRGKEEIEWDLVALAATWVWHAQGRDSTARWRKHYFPSYTGFQNAGFMGNQSLRTRREAPFPAMLNLVRRFRSSDPRDKVFAVLQHPIIQIPAYSESESAATMYPSDSSDNVSIPRKNQILCTFSLR
jgi:hypothetical protein